MEVVTPPTTLSWSWRSSCLYSSAVGTNGTTPQALTEARLPGGAPIPGCQQGPPCRASSWQQHPPSERVIPHTVSLELARTTKRTKWARWILGKASLSFSHTHTEPCLVRRDTTQAHIPVSGALHARTPAQLEAVLVILGLALHDSWVLFFYDTHFLQ